MNIVSVEAFAYALARLSYYAFLGAFLASWSGRFFGQVSWNGVWLFLRRNPRFRRFRVADARRAALARRRHFSVVLQLKRSDAELLLECFCSEYGISKADGDRLASVIADQCFRWGVSYGDLA